MICDCCKKEFKEVSRYKGLCLDCDVELYKIQQAKNIDEDDEDDWENY